MTDQERIQLFRYNQHDIRCLTISQLEDYQRLLRLRIIELEDAAEEMRKLLSS